jgi:chemotaxis protein MotB
MAKKKRHGGHEAAHADERWLITYADMITLLMVFFIVLYSMSSTDVVKFKAMAEELSSAFNTQVFSEKVPVAIADQPVGQLAPAVNPADSSGSPDFSAVQAAINDYAISNGLEGQLEVVDSKEGVVIRIAGELLFPSGRAALRPEARTAIAKVAASLRGLPNPIRVEGHTDAGPTVGGFFADNWELSAERALAVLRELLRDGVAAGRLSAAGRAATVPLVRESDEAARAKNRRVEIILLSRPGEIAPPGLDAGPTLPSIAPISPEVLP